LGQGFAYHTVTRHIYIRFTTVEPQAHCEALGLVLADSVGQLAGLDFGINVHVCLGSRTSKTFVDVRDDTVDDGWWPLDEG